MPARSTPGHRNAAERQRVLARLMQDTGKGDWQAFGTLYAKTSPQIYSLTLSMTDYAQASEDLLQDIYITVWRRARRYQPEKASVMTWLITIARNRTLDWLRSQQAGVNKLMSQRSPEAMDLAAGNPSAEQLADDAASRTDLLECLEQLSPEQRQAVVLAYLEGHTHAELAERLSSALGTVKSWIRRGLDRLKRCLVHLGADT